MATTSVRRSWSRAKAFKPQAAASSSRRVPPSAPGGGRPEPQQAQSQHDVACRAMPVLERVEQRVAVRPAVVAMPGEDIVPVRLPSSPSPRNLPTDEVDVAVIGSDIAGVAAALAILRASPNARVVLYDSSPEPPSARDGGALLSVNGLRALQALDPAVYGRLAVEQSTALLENLFFDLEGELVRRVPLGASAAGASAGGGRRRTVRRTAPTARGRAAPTPLASPDPSAPPMMVGLYELREAITEALPLEVEIFGRHHVHSIEALTVPVNDEDGEEAQGGALIHFASSPNGQPVRCVRARMVIGADGPFSAVKRLQFDAPAEPQPTGRVVWRGRFTLRTRDPDFARLRSFTTATRTWVDLRAPAGSERQVSLAPAGPNTYVWTASCPASMLQQRGLSTAGGDASPYWRCVAMFEDFPQDAFAAMRATAASAVVEQPAARVAAAPLAAPWAWFAGPVGLVGDAVHATPADEAAASSINLALEDAAVLGAAVRQYGMSQRALAEYARLRGPRVSGLLSLPPASPERLRLRDAPFLPQQQPAAAPQPAAAEEEAPVAAAAGVAAAAAATAVEPALPAVTAAELAPAVAAAEATPVAAPLAAAAAPSLPDFSRPSGGASRSPGPGLTPAPATPSAAAAAPSSPYFLARPSGARRLGPIPAAFAAVVSILSVAAAKAVAAQAAPKAQAASAAADVAPSDNAATAAAALGPSSAPSSTPTLPYAHDATPAYVWRSLLLSSSPGEAAAPASSQASPAAGAAAPAAEYCSVETPTSVWRTLLLPLAQSELAALPFDAERTPAQVWASLLRPPTAAASAPVAAVALPGSPRGAAAAAAAELLPRPVLKSKPLAPPADLAAPSLEARPPATAASSVAGGRTRSERRGPPAAASAVEASAPAASTAVAGPVSPSSTRRAGKAAPGGGKHARRASAKGAAAKAAKAAAATMTMSLSAAAALGGVMHGAHVPVDVAHSAVHGAVHVHGAVSVWWQALDNLASASLSSIDA